MAQLGKLLLAVALGLALLGVLLLAGERLGLGRLPLGRLPGDLTFERRGFRIWIPLGTSLLVSVVGSAILFALRHWFRR